MAFLRNSLDVLKRVQDIGTSGESDLEERLNDDWLRIHAQISAVGNASEATRQDLNALMRRYTSLVQGGS